MMRKHFYSQTGIIQLGLIGTQHMVSVHEQQLLFGVFLIQLCQESILQNNKNKQCYVGNWKLSQLIHNVSASSKGTST